MTMSDNALDALRLQIIWDRMLAIVEEQAQILIRTAFSPTVREAGDLSAGLFDPEGRMLAQAVTGTPGHVNAMAASVGVFLQKFPIERLRPGDVLLTNDPWHGTGHLNDFTVVTPVYRAESSGDICVALFASTTHIADVGGLGFGPDGRQVFEEGLNIPITHLFRAGALNEDLMSILRANVRDPFVAEGDLYSLAACNEAASGRLLEMMSEFSLADLTAAADHILSSSERAMKAAVGALPAGRYENVMRIDGYDTPIDLACAVEIDGGAMMIDFAGTSPMSPRGVNVPLTYTQAYASFGARCVVGGEIPNNHGSLGVVKVTAPAGSILNAQRPAAVSARHAVGQMLPDVVLGCLAQAGVATPAEGTSCLFNPVFLGGPGVAGEMSPSDEAFVINPFYNGGTGARPGKDGLSTTAFPSGVKNTPTEINETTAPLIVWRKEYRQGSGGAGAYRGGLGQVLVFTHADGKPFAISKMFDRIGHPPRGREGGEAGMLGAVYLIEDGTRRELRGMGRDIVPAGAQLVIETPGGGGLGDPASRDPAAIATDQRDGLLAHE